MELKLVVKLLRTPELLLLLDEELFFEKDDITLLTLVGLEPSFELLPDSENHVFYLYSFRQCSLHLLETGGKEDTAGLETETGR